MKKCYNAGKISGLSYLDAYNKFDRYDKDIERRGMLPVNPMKVGLRPRRPWWMHLVYDLGLLIGCSHVVFQHDWEESRGARIEHCVARLLRKKIIYLI